MLMSNFSNSSFEAGIDEAGRGSLAGPVTAAAVILPKNYSNDALNDSKKLSEKKRIELKCIIENDSIDYAVCSISPATIDKINILEASMLAMRNATHSLNKAPSHILIDGNKIPTNLNCPATAIVKGDNLSLTIAAASILAKVARDQIMEDLAEDFPKYGWETNVGYGTKAHIQGISQYGITPHHRLSFKPIHKML